MYREHFIKDFSQLGSKILNFLSGKQPLPNLEKAIENSAKFNLFFTHEMQRKALETLSLKCLNGAALTEWTDPWTESICESNKAVTIIMAGNIPMVGFHDLLTTLASGRKARVKLSSNDKYLIPALLGTLNRINKYWCGRVKFINEADESPDMIITTGGNESANYFRQRYKSVPSIIRGGKSSVAVIKGNENQEDFQNLASDMFLYFGMGCRNVSTLLIPVNYSLKKFVSELLSYSSILSNESYRDLYRYQKALAVAGGEWFYDAGYFLIKKGTQLPPPLAVINVLEYNADSVIDEFLISNRHILQCVVNHSIDGKIILFGESQAPSLTDYADGINSLEFILKNC